MKPHTWVIEYVDGGAVDGHFWLCSVCGASGGPVWTVSLAPTMTPFLADGSGLKLGDDCDESARLIAEHLAKPKPSPETPPSKPRLTAIRAAIIETAVCDFEEKERLFNEKIGDEEVARDFEQAVAEMRDDGPGYLRELLDDRYELLRDLAEARERIASLEGK